MHIEHVELLKIARDLHDIPRGMERFSEYLRLITNDDQSDVRFAPLVAMNPMGREHVAERLDELLAMGAEQIAADAGREAERRLADAPGDFKHGLVVMDDVRGGWTNRYTSDAAGRFPDKIPHNVKVGWISTGWWVSETPTPERLRQVVLDSIFRTVYRQQHGLAKTLRQMMAQEGSAQAFAGMRPTLDDEDIAYSRFVIEPLLDSSDYAVCFAAMYGDNGARTVGYPPLGLSDYAGFAVALADALA
jgi:hypothetical protein